MVKMNNEFIENNSQIIYEWLFVIAKYSPDMKLSEFILLIKDIEEFYKQSIKKIKELRG